MEVGGQEGIMMWTYDAREARKFFSIALLKVLAPPFHPNLHPVRTLARTQ